MPIIPTVKGPQVQTQALQPNYQNNVDVSSGAVAMGRALNDVGEAIDLKLERDAEAKANETDVKITEDFQDWEDKNRGKYTNKNAEGYKAAVDAWWKQAATTYGAELDDRAKSKISKTLARRKAVETGLAGRYETVEKEKYLDSTTDSAINNARVTALRTGDYVGEAGRIRNLVAEQAARKNWDKDQRDEEVNKRLATFHAAVVAQMSERDAAGAKLYLDEAIKRGEIDPDNQTHLEQIVKDEAGNQFAKVEGARIYAMGEKERAAAFAAIKDPMVLEKTQIQVNSLEAQALASKKKQWSDAAQEAFGLFNNGKAIPATVWARMDQENDVPRLREMMRMRSERLAAGRGVKTDMATYIDLRERLARGENIDLRAYTEKIAPGQMEQLLDIKTSGSKGGSRQDSMLSDEARINAGLTSAGIDKKKNPEAAVKFMGEVDRRVRELSAANGGKPVSPTDKQRIIDELTMDKVYVDEFGRDPQKPTTQLTPEQIGKAYVKVGDREVKLSSIPLADRLDITRALRSRGLPVSEQTIAEMYLKANGAKAPAPAAAPRPANTLQSKIAAASAGQKPSPYDPPEVWDAYRKWQANKK